MLLVVLLAVLLAVLEVAQRVSGEAAVALRVKLATTRWMAAQARRVQLCSKVSRTWVRSPTRYRCKTFRPSRTWWRTSTRRISGPTTACRRLGPLQGKPRAGLHQAQDGTRLRAARAASRRKARPCVAKQVRMLYVGKAHNGHGREFGQRTPLLARHEW